MAGTSYVVHESEEMTGDRIDALSIAVASQISTVEGYVSSHAADTDLHTSSSERATWNAAITALQNALSTLVGSDSGKSARQIAALAIAAWVADAPTSFDTLKEIADWILNDTTGAAKMANDIAELKSGKVDKVSGKGLSTNDYTTEEQSKLAGIAAGATAVSVDQTLTTQGAAADAKAVGDALRSGFTEWEFSGVPSGLTIKRVWYETSTPVGARWVVSFNEYVGLNIANQASTSATELTFSASEFTGMTATRHLVTPTKTSQLTNDGDGTNAFVKTNDSRLSDARTPTAHTHAMADVTGLGAALDGKASLSDLPYRLVEPGEWEFSGSGVQDGHVYSVVESYVEPSYAYDLYDNGTIISSYGTSERYDVGDAIDFSESGGPPVAIVATRTGIHLHDRAGNRVVVTGDTTLTLPAANPGYLRDFLVRLEISGSTVPTITFAAPTGESITYETDGDEFPVPDAEGTWLYSFTEDCVAHKFAVSLKKVNEVLQGGS